MFFGSGIDKSGVLFFTRSGKDLGDGVPYIYLM